MNKAKPGTIIDTTLPQPKNIPAVPGLGIAGDVICPILSIAGRDVVCKKHACEWWMELQLGDNMVGRCAVSWAPKLMIDLRVEVEKMRKVLDG